MGVDIQYFQDLKMGEPAVYTSRFIATFLGFVLAGVPPLCGQQPPAPKTERTEGVEHFPDPAIADVLWAVVKTEAGNTETVTRVYQSGAGGGQLLMEQAKTTKVDAQTTQVTKTTFNVDAQGNRRTVQVVQEERRTSKNGEEQVTRTASTPDLAGRMNVVRRENEVKRPTAPGEWTTTTSILLPSINGGFGQARSVVQTERQKAPGVTEVNRVSSIPDDNGRWSPLEQTSSLVDERKGGPRSEQEQIYRPDLNGRLALSERNVKSYQKDAAGREYWTTETYGGKDTGFYPGAGLPLERKVTAVREKLPDGSERTVQRVAAWNPQDRSAGLRPVEETVTTSKALGGGVTEVMVETRALDINGNMKTAATRKVRISDR